jgi:hypothetical protein
MRAEWVSSSFLLLIRAEFAGSDLVLSRDRQNPHLTLALPPTTPATPAARVEPALALPVGGAMTLCLLGVMLMRRRQRTAPRALTGTEPA